MEGIVAGVPMICWPRFSDQQINSRLLSHVWKIGLDMKDTCDRTTIEKMVNDLVEEKKAEFMKSYFSKQSVTEGGSSHSNLINLIEDIRLSSR